jgi:hypothetical protein
LPAWALLPAAGKLVTSSIRHPNSGKAVYVDRRDHKVAVESVNVNGEWASKQGSGVYAAEKPPKG